MEVKSTQLDRIRGVLAPEIEQGAASVAAKGESIVIGVSNVLLFESGQADVKPEFEPLAKRIAEALEKEPGPINIVGHTDNVRPKATSRFKSNFDLSVKRAESVAAAIRPGITQPDRIAISGRGEDDPVAPNDTAEGRAQNRRVDIGIPREETLGAVAQLPSAESQAIAPADGTAPSAGEQIQPVEGEPAQPDSAQPAEPAEPADPAAPAEE
jgi:type VI secretion system protein ImpK